jgi:tetratricopeptide (TPR) repeat protein
MDAPLVSIVTRTLGRECLAEAAASVAAQTYRPLEWVVVDAAGRGAVSIDAGHGVSTRVTGSDRPLQRSAAANAGLGASTGRWICLLDDDDLLKPAHIADLVAALLRRPDVKLAYSDAEMWDAPGVVASHVIYPFSRLMLTERNLLTVNSALFDRVLLQEHAVRFDPSLDYFEDWDFWLQCARHTQFLRVPGATAVYRTFLSSSGILQVDRGTPEPRMLHDRSVVRMRYADDRAAAEAAFEADARAALQAAAQGDNKAAVTHWHAAYVANPFNAEVTTRYAEACYVLGNLPRATQVLQTGAELMPDESSILWNLALVMDAQRDAEGAAAMRARALALDPALLQGQDGAP